MRASGGTTILVVEDEPLVRLSVRYYLERSGYVVIEAECASEALRALREFGVDLLLTDLALGNGRGLELIRCARQLNPELRWLVMSAYPRAPFTTSEAGHERGQFLQKPFEEAELLARVGECLTQRQF